MTSPVTLFNQLAVTFYGIGTTVRLLPSNYTTLVQVQQLASSNFKFIRIETAVTDPGFSFQGLGDTQNDSFWAAESIPFSTIISYLASINVKIILTVLPPTSWLQNGELTGTLSLTSFATMIVSAYKFFDDIQPGIIHSISLFNEPDVSPIIFANNLISLGTLVRNTLLTRGYVNVKLIGPSLSQVSPKTVGVISQSNVFKQELITSPNTFDYWDIHSIENSADSIYYNAQDYSSRTYLQDRLRADRVNFESVNLSLKKIVSKLVTRATYFPGVVGDNGINSSNLVEYGIRIAENIVAALENRFGIILIGQVVEDSINGDYDSLLVPITDVYKPYYELLQLFSNNLPVQGSVYQDEPLDKINDTTIKSVVIATNSMSFCSVLCRPESDVFSGKLTLTINNPIWTPAYEFTNLSFNVYPSTTDISSTIVSFSQIYEGSATFRLVDIPYNCVLFLTGDLQVIPPPAPPVTPAPSTSYNETIIQVPMLYGVPVGIPVSGTIYYDTQQNVTKVYDSISGWIVITPLTPP
jgi:hypothetical protein